MTKYVEVNRTRLCACACLSQSRYPRASRDITGNTRLNVLRATFYVRVPRVSIHYYAQVQAASFDDYQSGCRLPPLGLVTTPWMRPLHMPGLSH